MHSKISDWDSHPHLLVECILDNVHASGQHEHACKDTTGVLEQLANASSPCSSDLTRKEPNIADVIKADDFEEAEHRLHIDYSYWSTEHVLRVCFSCTLLTASSSAPGPFSCRKKVARSGLFMLQLHAFHKQWTSSTTNHVTAPLLNAQSMSAAQS